jgi:hypothetical protein
MNTLVITAETNENTIDGVSYHFTKNNIDYSIFRKADCVEVWKTNNQRGSISNDCFWNGVNNQGRQMSKFLKQAMEMIEA